MEPKVASSNLAGCTRCNQQPKQANHQRSSPNEAALVSSIRAFFIARGRETLVAAAIRYWGSAKERATPEVAANAERPILGGHEEGRLFGLVPVPRKTSPTLAPRVGGRT